MIKHSIIPGKMQVNIEKVDGKPSMSLISYSEIKEHKGKQYLGDAEYTVIYFDDIEQLKVFAAVLSKCVESADKMTNQEIAHFRIL